MEHKCSFGKGIVIKPDGINELLPCFYEETEVHKNVTVIVSKCKRCGSIEYDWRRQDDTIDMTPDEYYMEQNE